MLSAGGAAAEQTETHTHEGWTAVEALPTESGSYYLTKDIEITSAWKISSGMNITLCLNDHSITMTAAGLGIIIDGGTLNLYDCGTTVYSYTIDKQPATIGSGFLSRRLYYPCRRKSRSRNTLKNKCQQVQHVRGDADRE